MRIKKFNRFLSFLVIFSLISVSSIQTINAASITMTHASLTLSNSNPGTSANETLSWDPSNTTSTISTILVQYATTATGTTIPSGLSMGSTPTVSVTGFGSATATGAYDSSTGVLTVTLSAATAPTSPSTLTIDAVTNPSAGVFYTQVSTETSTPTLVDYGVMETQTVTQVSVTGTMDPSLSFSVTGVASGTSTSTTGGEIIIPKF